MHMIHNCISYRAEEMRYDAICHQTGSYKCFRKKIKDFSRTFPGLLLHFSSTFTGPLSDSGEYCYFEMVFKA